jgi:hypothetical protein
MISAQCSELAGCWQRTGAEAELKNKKRLTVFHIFLSFTKEGRRKW